MLYVLRKHHCLMAVVLFYCIKLVRRINEFVHLHTLAFEFSLIT